MGVAMVATLSNLKSGVFGPEALHAMSRAFDEACLALSVNRGDAQGRNVIAIRIVELARRGEFDADRLRDRVLWESGETKATKDVQTDDHLLLHREICALRRAIRRADDHSAFETHCILKDRLRPMEAKVGGMAPQSDAGAVRKLRDVANLAASEGERELARTARRVARTFADTLTRLDLADLRALLPIAARIDTERSSATGPGH
jgi:hypothetical protein